MRRLVFLKSPLLFLLVCMVKVVLPLQLSAQGAKWIEKGEAAFADQNYSKAIEYFSWAKKKKAGTIAYEGLGKCYWATQAYDKAENCYRLAAQDPQSSPLNYFYLGRALLANQKNQAAESAFRQFAQAAPNNPLTAFAEINTYFPIFLADSSNFRVVKMPFNSKASDFAPAWYGDGIAFSSARHGKANLRTISTVDGAPLTDLWYTQPDSSGKWAKPSPIAALNSPLNEGPLSIDSAHKKLYFTRNNPEFEPQRQQRSGLNRLRIYQADWVDGNWTNVQGLPFNHSDHPVGHPTISSDGKRLYFAAELPDGIGGTDIYFVERKGDSWSKPQMLGPAINTPGDEMFPFLQADGTLFFASDGHLGLGGLDIFSARPDSTGAWKKPVNLGYPINTHTDDFGYISRDQGKSGFFSSNRRSKNDNIYSFERLRPNFDCVPQKQNNYCFQFTDRGTMDLDSETSALIYEWNMGDGTRLYGETVSHCFPGPGDYTVKLNLVDTITGFNFFNQTTYDMQLTDIEQVYIEGPDTVAVGQTAQYNGAKTSLPDCDTAAFYWELSDGREATGPIVEHIFSRPGRYQIRLGVEGRDGESTTCLSCVYRDILVLPSPRLLDIEDSLKHVRELEADARYNRPGYQDSIAQVEAMISTLKKATHPPANQIPEKPGTSIIETESPKRSSPQSYDVQKSDEYVESIMVKVEDENAQEENNNQYVRIPAKVNRHNVTLFEGVVRDSKGQPLAPEVSLEDLAKGLRIVKTKTDPDGKFRLELPNGKLYGYFIEMPDFYPVSNHLDLRNVTRLAGEPEILIKEEITMMTIHEIFEQGISVRINNVFFDYDKATLRPESHLELDRLARILIENPELDVEILGHTDSDGPPEYNLALSHRRALAVLRYLILAGYDVNKITANGYGETRPIATNLTPEGKQMNRRVEFRLIPSKK